MSLSRNRFPLSGDGGAQATILLAVLKNKFAIGADDIVLF
jgi:hypothetical protein